MFKFFRSNLSKFIAKHSNFRIHEENGTRYLIIDKFVSEFQIRELLDALWNDKIDLAFHDNVYPTISDPGAYFSYSSQKSPNKDFWSMTLGNHGWSGGIYHISTATLGRQIESLIKKNEIDRIRISKVVFFSNYEIKSEELSSKKDLELKDLHRKMTATEILNRINSKDPRQIWEAACEIIAQGQDKNALAALTPNIEEIKVSTRGIELGGAFAPNQRFLDGAIKTLEFHRDSNSCSCQLYGIHECMDPEIQVKKGYLSIEKIIRIEDKWIDYYDANCTRCQQKFRILEREGHYKWWEWERID